MNTQSAPNTVNREMISNMTTRSDETPADEIRRRRKALLGVSGKREMSQKELADAAGLAIETIGNIENAKSPKPSTLPRVRATLARLEAEQGIPSAPAMVLPPMLQAALATGTPGVERYRQRGPLVEVFMLIRPTGMSQADFDQIVADFDAGL